MVFRVGPSVALRNIPLAFLMKKFTFATAARVALAVGTMHALGEKLLVWLPVHAILMTGLHKREGSVAKGSCGWYSFSPFWPA